LPGVTEKTANEFGEVLFIYNPSPGQWQLNATAGPTGAVFMYLAQENSPVGFVPCTLAGRGEVEVALTVERQAVNLVKVAFQ
jgi:hypothetical protein